MAALADMQASIARIDERTAITHDLLKSHIERSDGVHDALHHRINEAVRHADDGDGALGKRMDDGARKINWLMGGGATLSTLAGAKLTGAWEALRDFFVG